MVTTRQLRAKSGGKAYQMSEELIQQVEFKLSSADILALNTSPAEIVPAPGPNKVIEFIAASLFLNFGTVQYATNGTLVFIHGATAGSNWQSSAVPGANFLYGAADAFLRLGGRINSSLDYSTMIANNQLSLAVGTGDPTAGDGTVSGVVTYRTVDFNDDAQL